MEPNQQLTQPQPPVQPVQPERPTVYKRKSFGRKLLSLLMIFVLLAAAAAGGYFYRDSEAKKDAKANQTEASSLKSNLDKVQKSLADAVAAAKKSAGSCNGTSDEQFRNIESAIKSGNAAAIQSYMQPSVNVILAASEAYGPREPAQAVKDLDYLNKATDPWNFSLPSATLSEYQKGDYKQYFPQGSLVGKSANDNVVSFQFDSCGKIYGIFMTTNAALL